MGTAKDRRPKAELKNVDTRVVSIVDRPANEAPWILVKRQSEENMKRQVHAEGQATTVAKQDGAPEQVSFAGVLGGEPVPTGAPAASEPGPGAEAAAPDGEPAGEEVVSIVKLVHGRLLGGLSEELGKLAAAVEAVRGLGEQPAGDEVRAHLAAVAKGLGALAEGLGVKPAPAVLAGPAEILAKSLADLTAVVERVRGLGDAGEIPTALLVDVHGIAEAVSKALPPAAPAGEFDPFEALLAEGLAVESREGDEIVVKVGAKMAKTRLARLKSALALLGDLVKEVEGENVAKTAGEPPRITAAATGMSLQLPEDVHALQGQVAELKAKLEAVEKGAAEQAEALGNRLGVLEKMQPATDADPPAPVAKTRDEMGWGGVLGIKR